MRGSPINSVIKTLKIFLKSLPTKSYFNLVTFATDKESLFAESMPYNDRTLDQATRFVTSILSGGGTNIMQPLQAILSAPSLEGRPRQGGCWLLVVGCWLLVVGCWLLVVGVGCW